MNRPEIRTSWSQHTSLSPPRGEALLDEINDVVFRLYDLRGDLPALKVIFSSF
jgi:hypothetical protein